jgi:uncharacterized membrane protein YhhN
MLQRSNNWWLIAVGWFVAELIAEAVRWDYPLIHAIVKGGIMPLLIVVYIFIGKPARSAHRNLFLAGMGASWFGDLFLLREEDAFFTLGLAAFLIAHAAYAFAFSKAQKATIQIPLVKKYPLFVIGAFGFGTIMFTLFYPNLKGMLIPVIFYIALILIMTLSAISRYGRTNRKSFQWIVAGGAFFLVSDSILGYNRFTQPLPWSNIWIMSTYMLAQFGLTKGMMLHEEGMD